MVGFCLEVGRGSQSVVQGS